MRCFVCGCEVNPRTGMCPICQRQITMEIRKNDPVRIQKKSNTLLTVLLIILGCILVVSTVLLAVYFGLTGKSNDDFLQKVAHASYVEQFSAQVANEYGVYSTKDPSVSAEGVYCATDVDMDKDGNSEFVGIFCKKSGSDLQLCMVVYTCDISVIETQKKQLEKEYKKTGEYPACSAAVHESDIFILSQEEDYIESENHVPNESAFYCVETEAQNYLVFERVRYHEGYQYETHIFGLENGAPCEKGNLFIPDLTQQQSYLVYSTKLPENLQITNESLTFADNEAGEDISENYFGSGQIVLFYADAEDDVTYNVYYASDDAAVKAFFASYSVEKLQPVVQNGWQKGREYALALDEENMKQMYSYCYFVESTGSDSAKANYQFKDFTNIQAALQ